MGPCCGAGIEAEPRLTCQEWLREAQQIKVQHSPGTWGFLFTVPRVDVAVATAAVAAPVVAEIARDDPQPDPVETLKKLTAMLDEGLISQAEFDTKKAEVLQRM